MRTVDGFETSLSSPAKLYTDARIGNDRGEAAVGIVLCDHNGAPVERIGRVLGTGYDVSESGVVEAQAITDAITNCREATGLTHAIIYNDNMDAIRTHTQRLTEGQYDDFGYIRLECVDRDENREAHIEAERHTSI
jgi:ribonuclease HI